MSNELILDEYILINTLGQGSSGLVKLAQHVESKKYYAIKILNKNLENYEAHV